MGHVLKTSKLTFESVARNAKALGASVLIGENGAVITSPHNPLIKINVSTPNEAVLVLGKLTVQGEFLL